MTTEDKKILRINDAISAVSNGQIAIEAVADADLAFKMWGGKDYDGVVVKFLAKDKAGRLLSLVLQNVIGSIGILRHNVNGSIAGGPMTLTELNTLIDGDRLSTYQSDAVISVSNGVNHVANGTNLLAAYTAAKALTPGGNALAADNRALLIVPQGVYDLGTSPWLIDGEFVDIIGRGKARNFNAINIASPGTIVTSGTEADVPVVEWTARDFQMAGFSFIQSVDSRDIARVSNPTYFCDKAIFSDLSFVYDSGVTVPLASLSGTLGADNEIHGYWDNCHAETSFGYNSKMTGTFVDCSGSDYSFGGADTASDKAGFDGLAIRCAAGDYSFGSTVDQATVCDGTLVDCTAGDYSFGYCGGNTTGIGGVFSGGATRCTGKTYCFGATSDSTSAGTTVCSGTLVDCTAGDHSFGGQYGNFTGDARRCTGGDTCFAGPNASFIGYAKTCVAGDSSFGCGIVTASTGTLDDCTSIGRTVTMKRWSGLIKNCTLQEVTASTEVITASTGLRIFNSLLLGGADAPATVEAYSGACNVQMAHCRLNYDIDSVTPITNLIGNGYNSVDTSFTV